MLPRTTVNNLLPVVADSWETLRRCDVYRLLDQCGPPLWCTACEMIEELRPDLYAEAEQCRQELAAEIA